MPTLMEVESRERVNGYVSRISGPPVRVGTSWQPTVAFNLATPVALRALVSPGEFNRELMSRGFVVSTFAPKQGTRSNVGLPSLPLAQLPGSTRVGVGVGIGVGIGEAVATMVIGFEQLHEAILTQGYAQSKAEEDNQFFISILGALQPALEAVPLRVEQATTRKRKVKEREDRIRIHGYSRRSS